MTNSTRSAGPPRSSSSPAALDLVRPRYLSVPDYDPARTLGPEVAAVATLAGFPPDPEQRMLLDAAFALDKHGKSVAFEVVVIAPRQNLKTGFFKQVALGQLFVRDERLVVWSAHEFDTANEALNDLEALIEGSDTLSKRVKLTARGKVASHGAVPEIELTTGARLKVKTRTSGGGRGLSGRKVLLDEGYALQAGQVGALMPIMLAQPDPQVYIGSSACRPESVVLWDIVQRGRAGGDPRMVYAEWCAPAPEEACAGGEKCSHALGAEGCGCDRPELLAATHSAVTRGRILIQTILDLRKTMPPAEYGREVMGWHDDPVEGVSPISADDWSRRADPESVVCDPVALGLDVAPDGATAAIAVGGRRADGLGHGELIEHRAGTGWVVARLVELAKEHGPCVLVLDPAGPAGALIPDLMEAGFVTEPGPDQWRLHITGAREYAQACGALLGDIKNGRWRHLDQAPLNAAVEAARTRPLADAYAWSRKESGADICPLVAVTLARHGFATHGVVESPAPFVLWGS